MLPFVVRLLDLPLYTVGRDLSAAEREDILALIRPGDILLETSSVYPGWQRMERALLRSRYTHAALYIGLGMVIEATTGHPSGHGVAKTDLAAYLHGKISIALVRPPYKAQDNWAAVAYCLDNLGKPYETDFRIENDSAQYCAGLIWKALQAGPHPIRLPLVQLPVPVGGVTEAASPDMFLTMPGARIVLATPLRSALAHWPVGAAAAVLGAIGVYLAGLGGGVVGALTALAGGVYGGYRQAQAGEAFEEEAYRKHLLETVRRSS